MGFDVDLALWSETEFVNGLKNGISEYREFHGKRVLLCLGLGWGQKWNPDEILIKIHYLHVQIGQELDFHQSSH